MSLNEIFNMYFWIIDDDRCEVTVLHPLIDILKLCLLSTLCGVDELDKIVDYEENKKDIWVKKEVERDGMTTKEINCYLSSKNASAEKLLSYTRNRWKI